MAAQHKAWIDSAIALAMEASARARETDDFREGLAAYLEKRKPVWSL
jgi:methylglutaconyl-CoA hydratase